MGERTGIAWTDHTFNPWIGCQKVSAGCKNCYAEKLVTGRMGRTMLWGPSGKAFRERTKAAWTQARQWNRAALRDRVRRRVFCGSLCDVFEDHPEANAIRPDLWKLIEECTGLDWQLLTKRPENIERMLPQCWGSAGWPHVWLGTSVENQEAADERIPHLVRVPAMVRFLSCEPLLGWIDIRRWLNDAHPDGPLWGRIHWVIVGGESGPGYRPMDIEWASSLLSQCSFYAVPLFFKQLAGPKPGRGLSDVAEAWQLSEAFLQRFPR